MQEVATIVDSYCQQAVEHCAPAMSFSQPCAPPMASTIHSSVTVLGLLKLAVPSSLHLSSAVVSPVPSLLTASSPAVVSPVAALPLAPLPSLLPLWLVQPAPSNSPAAVTATVLTSAPGATVVVRVVLSVVSSGSRHAHFAKLNAEKAKDKELPWIHVSCSIQLEVLCC
jgi:hypothetical protein